MSDFDELRKKYTKFEYSSYDYKFDDKKLKIVYNFEIDGLEKFSPSWEISVKTLDYDEKILDRLVFSLGMMELVSYWKATCSPKIHINCASVSKVELAWWKNLYFNGLQEFFYVNSIHADFENLLEFVCDNNAPIFEKQDLNLNSCLVPVGGGKDSCVSLELCRGISEKAAFIIGDRFSSLECAKISDVDEIIVARRTIAPELLKLNSMGFLNGHTPFSGIVAFSSLLVAYLYGKRDIFLSNESSASEATVLGTNINHQYSKSFEFEQNFRYYVENFSPVPQINYLSLLRPISELQIAGIFSQFSEYLPIFRSCNRAAKTDSWCGKCAKCLFVFIMLSAFVDYDKLVEIIGNDMLNDADMSENFAELIGERKTKPFECVGTVSEVKNALGLLQNKFRNMGRDMPILLKDRNFEMDGLALSFMSDEHNLSEKYYSKLKAFVECLGDGL